MDFPVLSWMAIPPDWYTTNQQPHFSRIYQLCLPTPIINITQPHDLWIDRWIPDSILKDQLPSASSNLAHRYTLKFYTDETHSNTQIGACIQDWPSTRAELMGIFLALLVSPPNSIIHIYTDSQSAIHSINNVLQHKNARRLDLDSSYDNRFTHGSNEFRFMPQYNRTSIEQNIRKFIHKALHFRNYGAWSRLKSNIDCFVDKRFDYDWHTTWTTIKQIKFFKCASTKRNSLWSFIIKALHKELPIATRLKQQKPALSELIHFLNNTDEFQKLPPHIRSRTIYSLLGTLPDSFKYTSLLSDAKQAKISTTVISHLKKNLKLSRADSVRLGSKILMQIIILFKNHLWKDRCKRVIKWKQSRNITVQDKRISIHNRSSRTRRADRPVITEDEIIVLDGPDPTTQPIYAPVYNSPRQSFQDSLGLMHSQLQLYIKKYLLLPQVYKLLSSHYYFDIGI
ncbi:hypothetical protein RhiirA4_455211 [Rhizophagus irregularis]|uniref:RNase H type-1 domain-containing protein n=1 Tax=Rhizophagus irregularis TaxID=588596 RepID=A0A2I1G4T1_9GLOM|nr:hypothetical protein RhiirA4_455211 [Rhizophagus irregularis]